MGVPEQASIPTSAIPLPEVARIVDEVNPTRPPTVRCTPQGNIELMTKKELLDFKPAPRLEQVGDKRPKQMEERKHRIG